MAERALNTGPTSVCGADTSAAALITHRLRALVRARHAAYNSVRKLAAPRHRTLVFTDAATLARRTLLLDAKPLASGGYATVWRATEKLPDGRNLALAVKRLVVDTADAGQRVAVEREVEAMRSLPPHPNVLQLVGWIYCARDKPRHDEAYLLMELCGGSLAQVLVQRSTPSAQTGTTSPLAPADVAATWLDMLHAIAHLHTHALAHRDVKPENFLLSAAEGRWKLCDFGSATPGTPFRFVDGVTPQRALLAEEERIHASSTPQYRAPEMCDLRRGHEVGPKVDVWALGVSLYKMIFLRDLFGPGEERLGPLNFDARRTLTVEEAARRLPVGRPSDGPRSLPPPPRELEFLLALVRASLAPTPEERPDAVSLLQWVAAQSAGLRDLPLYTTQPVAGELAIRLAGVRNLWTPKVAGAAVYATFACAGIRRVSPSASTSAHHDWSWDVLLPAHSRSVAEFDLWATGGVLPDAFLGCVALPMEGLLPTDPRGPVELEQEWWPLQRRSSRSRVRGEVRLRVRWRPSGGADLRLGGNLDCVAPRHVCAPQFQIGEVLSDTFTDASVP